MPGKKKFDKPLPLEDYASLRRIARSYLLKERAGQTITPTGLVHEAYLRWVSESSAQHEASKSSIAAMARLMREILINRAQAKTRQKRGGKQVRVTLDEALVGQPQAATNDQLVELAEALQQLKIKDERLLTLIDLRFFCGLTLEETAKLLKISEATAKRHWSSAKAWLRDEIEKQKKKVA